ncbi:MAG: sulfatase-like hydrolase/transferase, partial [Ilumatobacter sp.]|nr:sulfatase-like hydrolase/transferase [Ilumatobacter sp.]
LEGPDADPGNVIQGYRSVATSPDQSKLTGAYTDGAIDFIRAQRNSPFFLYLPYAMPHIPLHPGAEFAGRSRRGTYGDVIEEIDWSDVEVNKTVDDFG